MAEVKPPSFQNFGQPSEGQIGASVANSGSQSGFGGQAKRIGEAAKHRVAEQVDSRKGALVSQLESIAEAFDEVASSLESKGVQGTDHLARLAASSVRSLCQNLEGRSTDELLSQARSQLRNHPLPVLLGCVALGFLGVRMLRE